MKMTRRSFLKTCGQIIAGGGLAVFGGYEYATRLEPEWLVVEHIQVPLRNLKPALEGFKIVHMSDIHLHPHTQIDFVQLAVAMTNDLNPDLIVLTGDYVLQGPDSIFELAPALASLNARHGLFTIFGNHDLWTNREIIHTGLKEARIPILNNRGISLNVGGELIYLAGIDDIWSGRPDMPAALEQAPPNTPIILLAHEPDFADTASLDGRIALQLSGHSHGGQVRLPGIGAPILPPLGRKYDQGLYKINDMWLYTTRGVGLGRIPIRINCPPEIAEITLTRV